MRLEGTLPNGVHYVMPDLSETPDVPTEITFSIGTSTMTLTYVDSMADELYDVQENAGGAARAALLQIIGGLSK